MGGLPFATKMKAVSTNVNAAFTYMTKAFVSAVAILVTAKQMTGFCLVWQWSLTRNQSIACDWIRKSKCGYN